MQYTLITRKGRVMQFYVQAVAELYQSIEGGVVISQQIFEQKEVDNTVN